MLRKRLSKCATIYLFAVVSLAFYLPQTEASILRKNKILNGRKEATDTASGIREGVIVFGKDPKNASFDEDASYQADSPGNVFDSKEAQWKRMFPSLLCGSDQMKFRAVGPPVKFFALDQHPPLPLSHVPPTCGYNMQRNPFGLVMNVPYHGCHVDQEDGNYKMSLLWNDIPVTLKCPNPQDGSTTSAPQVPVLPNPFLYPWLMPKPQETTTAAPPDPALSQVPPGFLHSLQLLWNQLLQNSNQPSSAAPPQDPALWNAYRSYLQQLLHNQDQFTTAPQDVIPQMPQHMFPYYFYQLPKMQYQPKELAKSAPNVPQNPLASHFGSLYNHPMVYGPPTAAPTSTDQSKPSLQGFNPYLYSLYAGQVSRGASATDSPPAGYPWYSQSGTPWWLKGKIPATEQINGHLYKSPQIFWPSEQPTTSAPTTNSPGEILFNPPVEVSKLQHNVAMQKSK